MTLCVKCPSCSIFRALVMECMSHANQLNRAGKKYINRFGFGFLPSCLGIQTHKQSFSPSQTSLPNRLLEGNIMEKQKHWKKAS